MRLFSYIFLVSSLDAFSIFNDDNVESLFDQKLIKNFQDEVTRMEHRGSVDTIIHNLGVLAMYMRLYKRIVPFKESFGYLHVFPSIELNSEFTRKCSGGFQTCLEEVFSLLEPIHPWLISNETEMEMPLTHEHLKTVINDNLFDLEVTISQIFCYLSYNELSILEYIPFCRYDVSSIDNSTEDTMIWRAEKMTKEGSFIDEFMGEPYECAIKSFCPDPCCLDVDPRSGLFTESECLLNACKNPEKCHLERSVNTEIPAMRTNQWNISCPCGNGMSFRADVAQCVHDNICGTTSVCSANEDCLNMLNENGYKCICQLGYYRSASNSCLPVETSMQHWDGLATNEDLPKTSSLSSFLLIPSLLILITLLHIIY